MPEPEVGRKAVLLKVVWASLFQTSLSILTLGLGFSLFRLMAAAGAVGMVEDGWIV